MHQMCSIAKLMVVLCMTTSSLCHIIRRDAAAEEAMSVTTMQTDAPQATTQRTNPSPSTAADAPNQIQVVEESEGASDVNNVLGAIATQDEQTDDGDSYGYDAQIQDGSRQVVDVHATTEAAVVAASTASTSPPTPSADTSTSDVETTTSGTEPTTAEGARDAESTGTSEPQPRLDPLTARCQEPPSAQLRMNFRRTNQHRKFPALAILPQEVDPHEEAGPSLVASPSDEYVNHTCPIELLHVSYSDDINRRSLCPWTYVPDEDPDRYPSTIQVAKCRCQQCIDTTASYEGAFSNDNDCRPVYFRMKVLRRGPCVNGMYMYNIVYENIPVACACVRPKV